MAKNTLVNVKQVELRIFYTTRDNKFCETNFGKKGLIFHGTTYNEFILEIKYLYSRIQFIVLTASHTNVCCF